MLGPLPRWLTECAYPFLPLSHRPSPKSHRVGSSTAIRSTTSEREVFRGCSHLFIFRPPSLLPPRSSPPLGIPNSDAQGGRGVYVRAQRGLLPPRASDMLAVRNRAIDGKGLSPSRFAALPAATGNFTPSTGSPEAVARLRFPQNVACGFPALRSSTVGSQHCKSLQLHIWEAQLWFQ